MSFHLSNIENVKGNGKYDDNDTYKEHKNDQIKLNHKAPCSTKPEPKLNP